MKQLSILFFILILISCSNKSPNENIRSENIIDKNLGEPNTEDNRKKISDSSEYWINIAYYKCLLSEASVCNCLSKNRHVLLFLDTLNNKAIVESSVHFSMETSTEFKITPDRRALNTFIFKNTDNPSDSGKGKILNNTLTLRFNNERIEFKKITLKTLDKPETSKAIYSRHSDMTEQLGSFNSISLLNYPYSYANDSSCQFLTFSKIKTLIAENKVFIFCSDDYYYNSLVIQDTINEYFHLVYNKGSVHLYYLGKDGRARGEKIDTSIMKRQILFSDKN